MHVNSMAGVSGGAVWGGAAGGGKLPRVCCAGVRRMRFAPLRPESSREGVATDARASQAGRIDVKRLAPMVGMVAVAMLVTGVVVDEQSCVSEDDAFIAALLFGLHGLGWSVALAHSLAASRLESLVRLQPLRSPNARYAAFVGLGLFVPILVAGGIYDEIIYCTDFGWGAGDDEAFFSYLMVLVVSASVMGAVLLSKTRATVRTTWTAAIDRLGLAGPNEPLPPKPTIKALTAALVDLPGGRSGSAAPVASKRSTGGALNLDGPAVATAGAVGLPQAVAPLVGVLVASFVTVATIDEAACMYEDPEILLFFLYLLHGIGWTKGLVDALAAGRLAVLVEPGRRRNPVVQVGAFVLGGLLMPGVLGVIIAAENTWYGEYGCRGDDDAVGIIVVLLMASAVGSGILYRAWTRKTVQQTWAVALSRANLSDADAPALPKPTLKALTTALQELSGD